MKKTSFALFALVVATALQAQVNPGVAQADHNQTQRDTEKVLRAAQPGQALPALYEDESADVGPQSVLRAIKQPWFRGTLDAQAFYTDNMFYQNKGEQSAGVAVTSLEAAFMTRPCITPYASYRAEVGYRHQFFNYFGHENVQGALDVSDFDFDASTAFAKVTAQTKHYQFGIGVDYTRLLGFKPVRADDYDEFYSEVVPRWSVQRNFRICDRSMVSLAYLGSFHFTDEAPPVIDPSTPSYIHLTGLADDRSERWEHTFIAAYSVALPHHFVAQPYYRFQFNDFVNTDNYLIQTVGLSVGWYPCANFSLRSFAGYNWSLAENSDAVEYTKLDVGAGVSATIRF